MKIGRKSALFIVLGVSLLVAVAEWSRQGWLGQDPERSDITNQVKNKAEEHKRYLKIPDQNEQNFQEDEPDLEKEYMLASKDVINKKRGNQVPHVEKYPIIFPRNKKTVLTAGKDEGQNKISSYKNSLSDSLYVFGMSKMFEGSGDIEASPTPEGSGDTETSPTDVPEMSTTLEGSGDVETPTTPEGSEDTHTTPTDVPEMSTTLKGPGDIETSPTPEGSEDTKTTPTDVPEVSTRPEVSRDTETTPTALTEIFTTPEGSGDEETYQTSVPDISTTPEGTGSIDTTVSSVTDIFTTPEASVSVQTTPTGLPGTYTTPESSVDDTKVTPTTKSEGSVDIKTTLTSVTDILTTPGDIETRSPSTNNIFTTILITETSVVTNDIGQTHSPTDASTGTESTALVMTSGVSGKSSTAQFTTNFQTPGDLSTPYDTTSKGSGGTTLTSSTESSNVNTIESQFSTITMGPTAKTTVGSGEIQTGSLVTTRDSGETLFTTISPLETGKTSSSVSSIISKSTSPSTKTQSLPTELPSSTILESSKPSTSAPLTTIFPTTVAITTNRIPVPTTAKITAKPNLPTIQPCQNGGTYDGIKCVCLAHFYGPFCEQIIDRVGIGRSVVANINVLLRFIHLIFHDDLKNDKSDEYKKFDTDFKKDMKVIYKNVPGYKDVKIREIREGSVIVDYDVIIEIEYKSDVNVTQQYKAARIYVEEGLNSISCDNPGDLPISNCISSDFQVPQTVNVESEKDVCMREIPPGFQDFYEPKVDGTGLVCVSQCDTLSTKYTSCQDGSCQIQNNTGPRCLCPRTDQYIYTSSNCNGRILKSGVYGGVGAAIAVLLIIICVAVFFFICKKKNKKWDPFANDFEENWYDEKEEDWHVGINNLGENVDFEDQVSSKDSFSSKREAFKPNLECIDPRFEVKIQRPQVSLG